MKKILVAMAALFVASACATPPTNREATAPANANTAAEPARVAMTEADAIAKEKGIWETIKLKDYDAFAAMLADDQQEVLPEGVMDKTASVAGVKQYEPSEVNFSDWKYVPIDKDAFLITYTVAVKGKYAGSDLPQGPARASSAWVNRAGKWQVIYHQETLAKPATPAPASKTATPKAVPSPGATPAPVTGPDPIANEKIVWDLFKSKNYDAFAELVAPEFVEVTAESVYDRAGTIKGVTMFDASRAVLSDFKAVNLDDDAALVTYMVKNPVPGFAPGGERHATIWVKRDGKWLGLFHQGGTPVTKAPPPPPPAKASVSPTTSK